MNVLRFSGDVAPLQGDVWGGMFPGIMWEAACRSVGD